MKVIGEIVGYVMKGGNLAPRKDEDKIKSINKVDYFFN